MSHLLITPLLLLTIFNAQAAAPTTSCGWYDNSSPQNIDFIDAESTWIVSMQGGHQAKGLPSPNFGKEFETKQSSYGYGCACITAVKDKASGNILEIKEFKVKKLSDCRTDKKLIGKFPPEVITPKKTIGTHKLDSSYLGKWAITNEDCAEGRSVTITASVLSFQGEADKTFKVVDEWSDATTWLELIERDKEQDDKYFRLKKLSPNTVEIQTSETMSKDETLAGLTCILKKK